jgi:hypothetical protein
VYQARDRIARPASCVGVSDNVSEQDNKSNTKTHPTTTNHEPPTNTATTNTNPPTHQPTSPPTIHHPHHQTQHTGSTHVRLRFAGPKPVCHLRCRICTTSTFQKREITASNQKKTTKSAFETERNEQSIRIVKRRQSSFGH